MSDNHVHIIYIDRNHPPAGDGIIKIVDDIDKYMPANVEYSKVYMIPNIEN